MFKQCSTYGIGKFLSQMTSLATSAVAESSASLGFALDIPNSHVFFGLGAAVRRVSHERQLWAVHVIRHEGRKGDVRCGCEFGALNRRTRQVVANQRVIALTKSPDCRNYRFC